MILFGLKLKNIAAKILKFLKKRNRPKLRSKDAKRRARKLQATPPWLTKDQLKEIEAIYKNCPKGYHVDHIVPLQGGNVRGLHVPWNLQYLPASTNFSKGNRVVADCNNVNSSIKCS